MDITAEIRIRNWSTIHHALTITGFPIENVQQFRLNKLIVFGKILKLFIVI